MGYGWHERATTATVRYQIGGDTPSVVYQIGKYEVTVPGETREVTYRVPSQRCDPREALPNMEITDGEIRIPMTDLVSEVLARVPPAELSVTLWSNAEVRSEFISRVVERWECDFTDEERRRLIRDLKQAVHSNAVDRLANSLGKIEYDVSKRSFFYHEVSATNDRLRELEQHLRGKYGDETIEVPRLKHEDHDPDFKISGTHWNQARDHWRRHVEERFPFVEDPKQETPGGESNAD